MSSSLASNNHGGNAACGGAELPTRIRAKLADQPDVREATMFGGVAFMVDDRMVVSAQRNDGGLLVRVDPGDDERLLARPGAERAHMGNDRSMGKGWISVAHHAVNTQAGFDFWMDAALAHHTAQTTN